LAVVAALCDVVLGSADHDPCDAWHEYEHSKLGLLCQAQFRGRLEVQDIRHPLLSYVVTIFPQFLHRLRRMMLPSGRRRV